MSNESPQDVFFDNLTIQHHRGPLIEENAYYPYGLTMAGISDKAVKFNYAENKYRYNKGSELQNKEFSDGSGLEMYATTYRSLDHQLGRFWQIDPLTEISEDVSPYTFGNDNPIINIDPLGLLSDSSHPQDLKPVTITPHSNSSSGLITAGTSVLRTRLPTDHPAPRLNYDPTLRIIPAEEANATSGLKQAPYKPGTSVIRYKSSVLGRYVRVFDSKNPRPNAVGKWIVKESEIKGLSPAQIKDKLALENLPDQMVEVNVPAGTNIEESVAGPNDWGNGGAIQYQLTGELKSDWFSNATDIPTAEMAPVPNEFTMPEAPFEEPEIPELPFIP